MERRAQVLDLAGSCSKGSVTGVRLHVRAVQRVPAQAAWWDCDQPEQQHGRQRLGVGARLQENEMEADHLGRPIRGGESPQRSCHGVWK